MKVELNKVRVEKILVKGQKYNQGDCNYQVTFVKGSEIVSHGLKEYVELKYFKIKDTNPDSTTRQLNLLPVLNNVLGSEQINN